MRRPLLVDYTTGFLVILVLGCSKKNKTDQDPVFQILSEQQTGISFNNRLRESDSLNILNYLYYYNGGGVAVGDINNDGLPDIYFSGNEVSNKLYLNKGNMQFTDITKTAGVACQGAWNTGISMVDINGDSLLDIYVCQVNNIAHLKGTNRLFINNGDLTFTESAENYGLDFRGFATHAAFLDYDRDGDLDCYLLNHSLKDPEQFKPVAVTRLMIDPDSGDKLLENQNGTYLDVSVKAMIFRSAIGFGLGIDVGDLNRDGWPDIYIGNDFHENDYLYINNRDGTFREVIAKSTGHTSNFTMGVAIADINNDTWPDILSLDMKPEDEKTFKMSGGWESFNIYQFKRSFGYHHQSPRNALQINQGGSYDNPVFSELACQFGIEATDWSWSPLICDFNGDGDKDIFVSNGIERRPNDLDFVNYYSDENYRNKQSTQKLFEIMPHGGSDNYLFLNNTKENRFNKILIEDRESKITNGATYSDLDKDGDLDIVCNNLNHSAYIIQNNHSVASFVSFQLKPNSGNTFALGAQITLYQKNKVQYQYINHVAGFQSGKEPVAYFATGSLPIDSVNIQWPNGTCQVINQLSPGFHLIKQNSQTNLDFCDLETKKKEWITLTPHHQNSSFDLEKEKWMPYSLSSFGPRIAIGKKYYYLTNSATRGSLHRLTDDLNVSALLKGEKNLRVGQEESDAAFADFNNDSIEDLFISIGGSTLQPDTSNYQPGLFLGNKDGSFNLSDCGLPKFVQNSSVVRTSDYDKDGDIDLFVGTLSRPESYGWSDPSILYTNEGKGTFIANDLPVTEMVFDAQWSDMDQDGFEDLVLAGHWMPVTILYNRNTYWEKVTLPASEGLWFSLRIEDLNQDNIPDIIAGNFGLNHPFECDSIQPIILYLNDFDGNGRVEPILTYAQDDKRYVYPNLELFLQQLPGRKKDFVFNKDFAGKSLTEIFTKTQLDKSTQKECNTLTSGYFLSDRESRTWNFLPLPADLQHSPIWSICRIENDMFAFGGNFYHMDPNWGRQDALFLTCKQYDHNLGWLSCSEANLGYLRRSEIRDLKIIRDRLYIASNNDTLISISLRK